MEARLLARRRLSRWAAAALKPAPPTPRVVVTGVGVVSPLGCGARGAWTRLLEGGSGLVSLANDERFARIPSQVAALVPPAQLQPLLERHVPKSDLRTMAPATTYALVAAEEALDDAGWRPTESGERDRTGVSVGVGMVDLVEIGEATRLLAERGPGRLSPHFVPRVLPNLAAGHLSIRHGFRGPNLCASTACASGSHALVEAARTIREGAASVMLCGGCEAPVGALAVAAFCRLRALSTRFNDHPEAASRPFDRNRDGFVVGEGAALLVLEELEHARRRGAPKIYAELLGFGASADAHHPTAPAPGGTGAALAVTRALHVAGVEPHEVGHVNAHATSTPLGDELEIQALRLVFGEHLERLRISATKGAHGHLLGAAGALESVFTVLACHEGWVPPTLNLDEVSEDLKSLNLVAKQKQKWDAEAGERRIALKNSFGFGGTNASLCFAEFQD